MTISAYETLYESSIAYGVRKALIAEQRKIDLDQKLKELQSNKRDLQQQVENLKNTIEMTQQRALEKREQEEKLHAEEVSFPVGLLCLYLPSYLFCMFLLFLLFRLND
jgi:dynein light intermediate chain